MRHCLLTGARLPSYFLLNFGLATHPGTGAKWHLPRITAEVTADTADEASKESMDGQHQNPPILKDQASTDQRAGTKLPPRLLSSTYFHASRQALSFASSLGASPSKALIPYRWKDDAAINAKEIVWREDMSDYVLELLRKGVFKDLRYLVSRPAAYVVACEDWREVQKYAQIGAVMWLGPDGIHGDDGDERARDCGSELECLASSEWQGQAPPAYAMYLYRGHHIPIYNLQTLLGLKYVTSLRELERSHFRKGLAILKQKNGTSKIHLKLWKLLGYLAQDRLAQPTPEA